MSTQPVDAQLVFGDTCVICQDYVSMRGRLDSCQHLFCVECIKQWAEIETKCPLCKARFTVIYPEEVGGSAEDDLAGVLHAEGVSQTDLPETYATRRSRTRGTSMSRGKQKPAKPIKVKKRDQVYEDPDDDGTYEGLDLDRVLCGTCGDGSDEINLMLCDGCDAGHHCYCVGLETVPLEEWKCRLCDATENDNDGDNTIGDGARTVASVRLIEEQHATAVETTLSDARRLARQRAASIRAQRSTRRTEFRFSTLTPESRAPRNESTRTAEKDLPVHTGHGAVPGVGFSYIQSRSFRTDRSGVAINDSRWQQIARVKELRAMWDKYRAGDVAFGGETGTHTNGVGGVFMGGENADDQRDVPTENEAAPTTSDADHALARRRAAAATLAGIGWGMANGKESLDANADFFTDYLPIQPSAGTGDTRALKRPRRREVYSASRAVTTTVSGRVPSRNVRPLPTQNKNVSLGQGPDRKGKWAGVDFSAPRVDTGKHTDTDEHTGWTSSDEEEDTVAKSHSRHSHDKQTLEKKTKPPQFLSERATGFVPTGSVTHVPPQLSAKQSEKKRKEMLRVAEQSGAPCKEKVIQMVKALLKPYWNKKKIVDKSVFKLLAKHASDSARASSSAAALKFGADEAHDFFREEAILHAVKRAVHAQLVRQGIDVDEEGV